MTNLTQTVNPPALLTMNFHGDEVVTFEADGTRYVAMRRIVENLDMDWATQLRKLEGQPAKFNCGHMPTVGADGRVREMLAMPVNKLPLWLATINPNKIKDADKRAKIELYQERSAQALYEFWTKGVAIRDDLAGTVISMDPQVMRAIGGMMKGVVEKRTKGLEDQIASLAAYIEAMGVSDPEKGSAVEFVTSKQVMTDFGFQPGEIRGRAGHLTHRLRKYSLEHHHPMRLTSEMKRNLFHVDAVRDWMEAGGRNWLTNKLVEVRSKQVGQNVLKLVS
jgi:hypothetical protein